VDEVKRAVFFVYSNIIAYTILLIGALTLFKIVFKWPVPVLGVLIFSTLLLVHITAYKMLQTPIREAHLEVLFRRIALIFAAFLLASLFLIL